MCNKAARTVIGAFWLYLFVLISTINTLNKNYLDFIKEQMSTVRYYNSISDDSTIEQKCTRNSDKKLGDVKHGRTI